MKTLITGGTSLLGKALAKTKPADIDLAQTWYSNHVGLPMYQMDVCYKSQVSYIFDRVQPEVVIHCAAIGSVDYAERNFTATREINVTGTENVLKATKDHGAKFVYISTNAVFDGNNPPYTEDADRQPINRYGSIKREAEDIVMKANNWLIIRPFLLFGWPYVGARQNWATTIMDNLVKGKVSRLVNDVYWQPTFADEAARVIWRLIEMGGKNEIYHVASDDRMTLYEFGLMVARVRYSDENLCQPVPSSEFAKMAPRPVDTQYDLSKIHGLGITLKSTLDGLKEMVR